MDLARMQTREEGVQNPENCVDVIYVWPLIENGTVRVAVAALLHFVVD